MSRTPIVSGIPITEQEIARFWARVDVGDPNVCWPWTGSRSRGYGLVQLAGGTRPAHRVAFAIARADVPRGILVCHSCDNPPCCNPDHLWTGTHADNTADMMAKGRNTTNPLRESDVLEMHRLRGEGVSVETLAQQYSVSVGTVCDTLSGRRWRHLAPATSVTTASLPGLDRSWHKTPEARDLWARYQRGEADEVDRFRVGLYRCLGIVKTYEQAAAMLERAVDK